MIKLIIKILKIMISTNTVPTSLSHRYQNLTADVAAAKKILVFGKIMFSSDKSRYLLKLLYV